MTTSEKEPKSRVSGGFKPVFMWLCASTGIFGLLGVGLVWAFKDLAYILHAMTHWHWFFLAVMVTLGNSTDRLTRLEHLTGTLGGILLGLFFCLG